MSYPKNRKGRWTKKECLKSGLQYQTRNSWREKAKGAYDAAKKNGWFDECVAHMAARFKWTKELCIEEARKYTSDTEWNKKHRSSRNVAKNKGWHDECIKHFPALPKPVVEFTKKECRKDAKKYIGRFEWQQNSSTIYHHARKKGWLDYCCQHMETQMGNGPKNFWSTASEKKKKDLVKQRVKTFKENWTKLSKKEKIKILDKRNPKEAGLHKFKGKYGDIIHAQSEWEIIMYNSLCKVLKPGRFTYANEDRVYLDLEPKLWTPDFIYRKKLIIEVKNPRYDSLTRFFMDTIFPFLNSKCTEKYSLAICYKSLSDTNISQFSDILKQLTFIHIAPSHKKFKKYEKKQNIYAH